MQEFNINIPNTFAFFDFDNKNCVVRNADNTDAAFKIAKQAVTQLYKERGIPYNITNLRDVISDRQQTLFIFSIETAIKAIA